MKLRNKNLFQLHEQQLIEKRRKLPDKQRIIELELEHACLHSCHHMFPHWNNSISSTETKRFYSGPRSKLPSHACPALEYLVGLFVSAGIQILHDWVIFFSNVSSEKPHLRLSSAFANSMSFLYSHIIFTKGRVLPRAKLSQWQVHLSAFQSSRQCSGFVIRNPFWFDTFLSPCKLVGVLLPIIIISCIFQFEIFYLCHFILYKALKTQRPKIWTIQMSVRKCQIHVH